ncbi:MAG: histidine phosphatase family protein [Treponemataceae bacterium]|nr:histidine phosphatase family protein [Treponemataceae bacterium]
MKFYSTNPWMTEAAAQLPDKEPAVLFMRHAERYSDPPDGDYSKLLLTPQGIKMARDIGSSIDRKIRLLRSSPVERCKQTLQEIVDSLPQGSKPDEDTEIKVSRLFSDIIGDPRPQEEGGVGWYEYFHYLQNHDIKGSRGVTLEEEAKQILDSLFKETLDSPEAQEEKEGWKEKPLLDIILSHDGNVVILASALFGLKTDLKWTKEWCQFTEGIFFYGTRKDFTALWRGQIKRFVDYLV